MATTNPFDLLDDDAEDVTQLAAAAQPQKVDKPAKLVPADAQPANLPSKPVPPTQAVREAKNAQGGGRGGGRGFGRGRGGGGGFNREPRPNDAAGNENGFSGGYRPSEEGDAVRPYERRGGYRPSEEGDAVRPSERRGGYGGPRGSFRGGRRGGFNNAEFGDGERPRRTYERRSGTGRGNEDKRDGAGRGNWGAPGDDIAPETEEPVVENEKNVVAEKPEGENEAADANKEAPVDEPEEKEPEEKEMTLEEYEKILEEKRKALQSLKTAEGRKVDVKEFESMHQLSNKKSNDEIFIKLGSEKDKRKDSADKEEKTKKSVSINEFLKPAEGENFYTRGGGRGRGRGRGRGGSGGGGGGGYGGNPTYPRNVSSPAIEDTAQFPVLGGK